MKKIMLSLFNRLDRRGQGEVSFEDFLASFFPLIEKQSSNHKIVLVKWMDLMFKSERLFERGKEIAMTKDPDQKFREAFGYLDKNQRGCNRVLTLGLNLKDLIEKASSFKGLDLLQEKFAEYANGGRMYLEDFKNMIQAKCLTRFQISMLMGENRRSHLEY